jgi:hypothetical protein
MKGDFSRRTFDPTKHYDRVRMQQGRVQLDADFNEQADIISYRAETAALDVIGGCGGPLHNAAFAVTASATPGDFLLGAGRYYVNGVLCENEQQRLFSRQPDFPAAAPVAAEGLYVLYLDVWRRHITAREDPLIREVALGGPDTTTRSKIVWQAKLWNVPGGTGGNCLTSFAAFDALVAPGSGRLRAEVKPAPTTAAPCEVTPAAGYRGLENQLYRVEIHTGGPLADATFKWSRDNGSIVTSVENIDVARREITVHDLGRDGVSGFAPDQWVELLSDATELDGQPREGLPVGRPGQLLQIDTIDEAKRIITVKTPPDPLPPSDDGTVRAIHLRRWDQFGSEATVTGVEAGTAPIELELGLQIRFSNGTYRSGDYWLIPARTATADAASGTIEWPVVGATAAFLPPAGTAHNICRIAMLRFDGGRALTTIEDCRKLFPPVTELTSLFHVGGDGQEVMPDLTISPPERVKLPAPVVVGVANGRWPVAGARVRFTITGGTGLLRPAGGGAGDVTPLDVTTGSDGLAACDWLLDGTNLSQQVEARLLDVADQPVHLPVRFNANLSVASQVAFDPGDCTALAGRKNVQDALDGMNQLARLFIVSGNNQEVMPSAVPNMADLVVLVANGCGPVAGAVVEFTVTSGGGSVTPASAATDASGLARVRWTPGSALGTQTVDATLTAGAAVHPPASVQFTANLSVAAAVAYRSTCTLLSTATTVQEALDLLCRALGAREPGVRISGVALRTGGGVALLNDSVIPPVALIEGLQVVCDQPLLAQTIVNKPVGFVTIELPFPTTGDEREFWRVPAPAFIGAQPIVLDATLSTDSTATNIIWQPSQPVQVWLRSNGPFANVDARIERLLVRLTLKGNFIWSQPRPESPRMYLDGDAFGVMNAGSTRTDIDFKDGTGDGVRGGDFEMWFWLRRPGSGTTRPTDFSIDLERLRVLADNPAFAELPATVTLEAPATETTVVRIASAAGDFEPVEVVVEVGAKTAEVRLVVRRDIADRGRPLRLSTSAGGVSRDFDVPLVTRRTPRTPRTRRPR